MAGVSVAAWLVATVASGGNSSLEILFGMIGPLVAASGSWVLAERTFWDKIIIIHGVKSWFGKRGALRGEGQRVSRHYYDLHRIFQSDLGAQAVADRALGVDCVAHARMFFNSPDLGLDHAVPGTFSLMPTDEMIEDLRRDYSRMAGMIIGDPPKFDEVMASIGALEEELNRRMAQQ